jgi:putative two-component system response regulator
LDKRKPRILVVDDSVETVEFLESSLKVFEYTVVKAFDGAEALDKAETHNPDLILLDYEMPKMKGMEVCKILKSKNHSRFLPIIMMTASKEANIIIKSLNCGADEFISKPFDIIELSARIKAMLRTKTLEDEIVQINKDLEEKVKDKTRKIESLYMETVKALAKALDAKDSYTRSHSDNVTKYSKAIAEEIGLSDEEIKDIQMAAQLHDLGKIGISDSILNKQEKLTEEEWEVIKHHSIRSAQILEPLESLDGVVDMVKEHHEKINGSGYPDGKKGIQIRLGARILAVADAYDAMTSERPYRKAFPKEKAVSELKKCKGTHFDPDIVEAFLRVLDRQQI